MGSHESLRLRHRFEPPHSSFPDPSSLMGLFSPVILVLLDTVKCLRDKLAMGHAIASQFIGDDLPSAWLLPHLA
jgi:hypothetical protein